MPLRAVLFDIGGPIDEEEQLERLFDQHIVEALRAQGIDATTRAVAGASEAAVAAFAPNAYQYICWRLASGDRAVAEAAYREVADRAVERDAIRGGMEVREGIADLIRGLARAGLLLGVVANQPARAAAHLEVAGIAGAFRYVGLSGDIGYRKPDPRLFVHVCEGLGVLPEHCLMVGDRMDNDIAPARALGMRAIRFRTGRHARQEPRTWEEAPDEDVASIGELRDAIWRVLYS
ncbi:MAG: HAD family hydrolase [Tepidiformaceae bacterium]